MRRVTVYVIIAANLVLLAALVAIVLYARHLTASVDARLTHRNCVAIENLKAGQREGAQATITGDQKLLDDHDQRGVPLPVPRQAITDDIATKQTIVDRFPELDCGPVP